MSSYFKALGLHVYLVTTKKSYIENGKYLETNAQAMIALKQTLNNDYLSKVANCDFTFVVWNTLISLEEQASNYMERESSEDGSNQTYFIVQGNDSLQVILEFNLDDCASTSNDNDSIDAHMLNNELALFCEDLHIK